MTDHVSEGEWERWRDDDRAWKQNAMRHLISHTDRLATLEASTGRAESAAATAETAKKWAVVGNVVGAIVNGMLLALGGLKGS
jgi:hypothetical protein